MYKDGGVMIDWCGTKVEKAALESNKTLKVKTSLQMNVLQAIEIDI